MTATRKTTTAFATVVALLVVAIAYLVTRQPVDATHQPANKAVASGEELVDVESGTATPILSATMRTSKPTDLIMSVSLECAILTKLLTQGSATAGASQDAVADASILVWIEDEKGAIVPISSISAPPQDPENQGSEDDKVTFCHRAEGRRVKDAEDAQDGIDRYQTFLDTKTANSFTWVLQNAGSGIHVYTVKATLDEDAPCSGEPGTGALDPEETCGDALIGNRMLVIQPEKFANDASV
jgi:hypothetical protein